MLKKGSIILICFSLIFYFEDILLGMFDPVVNTKDGFPIDIENSNSEASNLDYDNILTASDNSTPDFNANSKFEAIYSKLDNQFFNLKKYIDNKGYNEQLEKKVWLNNQKQLLQSLLSKLKSRIDTSDDNSKKIIQNLSNRFNGSLNLLKKYIEEKKIETKKYRLHKLNIQREEFNKKMQEFLKKINLYNNKDLRDKEIKLFSQNIKQSLDNLKNYIEQKYSKDKYEQEKILMEQNKNFLDLKTKLEIAFNNDIINLDIDKISENILNKIESKLKLNMNIDKNDLLNDFDLKLDFNLDKLKSYISKENLTDKKERISLVKEQKNSIDNLTKNIEEKLYSIKNKNKNDKKIILDSLNHKLQDNFEKLTKYIEERDDYLRLNRAIWIGEQQREIEKLANEFYSISPFIKNTREKEGITNIFDYKLQHGFNNMKDYIEEKVKKEKHERDSWINQQTEIMQKLAMEIKAQNNNKYLKDELLKKIDEKFLTVADGLKNDKNHIPQEGSNNLIKIVDLLDQKLSVTVEKIKDMVDEKMQLFDEKLQIVAQNMEKTFIELQDKKISNTAFATDFEDKMKLYFDNLNNNLTKKIKEFERKLAFAQSIVENKLKMVNKSEKLTKKSIDEKIKDIVQGELGALKEYRLKKFIKREKKKQKSKRVKLLKELLEKDLG